MEKTCPARTPLLGVNPPLANGYFPVPPGKIASVVTYLEMDHRPPRREASVIESLLPPQRWYAPDLDEYRAFYRLVGQDWLWFSRLLLADTALRSILTDPLVEVFLLSDGRRELGLLELDFREHAQCELAFIGLVKDAIGKGIGRFLLDFAIDRAWVRPIRRFWLHTCNFDHPGTIGFYRRSGFRPYALAVEVADDPRLTRHLPRSAAPHVPLVE